MPSRDTKLTLGDIKKSYRASLKSAIELGQMPSKATGLAPRVYDAVSAIALKYPETDTELIQKANKEFRDYLTWRRAIATRRK